MSKAIKKTFKTQYNPEQSAASRAENFFSCRQTHNNI